MVVGLVNMKHLADIDLALEVGDSQRLDTIGSRVFQTLKRAIVQLQLRPGQLLSEAEIAKQLGISRQPVREAFIKLADVGLLEIRPQRGSFVVLISPKEVENARFIREAIEIAVVRRAAEQATADDVAVLKGLIESQVEAAENDDHSGFMRLDDAMHRHIASCVDCDHAWRVIEDLKAQLDRVRFLSLPDATPMASIVEQHSRIIDAIAAGSPDQAEQAMRLHLAEVLNSLPVISAAHPDLFEN